MAAPFDPSPLLGVEPIFSTFYEQTSPRSLRSWSEERKITSKAGDAKKIRPLGRQMVNELTARFSALGAQFDKHGTPDKE